MPQTNDLHKYSQKNPGIIMIIKPNKFALLQFFIDFLGLIINISRLQRADLLVSKSLTPMLNTSLAQLQYTPASIFCVYSIFILSDTR